MNFQEKLKRLTEGKKRSEVARKAGLPSTVVSNYINRNSIPRADIAAKIAKALSVTVEWLVDDAQDWPPEPDAAAKASVHLLSDGDLLREFLRRRRLAQLDVEEKLARLEKLDWSSLRHRISTLPDDAPLPKDLRLEFIFLFALDSAMPRLLGLSDLNALEEIFHNDLPGADREQSDLSAKNLLDRFNRLMDRAEVAEFFHAGRSRIRSKDEEIEFGLIHRFAQTTGIKIALPDAPKG